MRTARAPEVRPSVCFAALAALAVSFLGPAGARAQRRLRPRTVVGYQAESPDDARLLGSLQRAVARRTPPRAVESLVGRAAIINTSRGSTDRNAIRGASIHTRDGGGGGDPIDLTRAHHVAYWARPGAASHDVAIAGVVWHPDGRAELFWGYVGPP